MRHVDNFFAEKSRVRTTTCTAFFEHYRGFVARIMASRSHGALFKPHGSEGRRAGNKVRELLRFFDRCEL